MTRTLTRWYPVLLMRDALGRFMQLRAAASRRLRPRSRRASAITSIQLALF